ncbi:MAG: T9SS type A sorting domain-containing protein [Bacteroidales bacterium]|nr:T9SS type A sorting domain-containing protein [Bacteroidales bacterium]
MKKQILILAIISVLFNIEVIAQESIVFEKTYRTETIDTVIMALTGAQTSDGGYLLGGYAAYGMYLSQMMFFKIDSVGNYEWKKMYGSLPCSSNMIHDMEPVGDGTFICCGEGTFSTEGAPGDLKPTNSMIMRVDENANIIWHKEFDAGYHENLYEVALSDTGFICVGYKQDITKMPEHYLWITGDVEGHYTNVRTLDLGLGWQTITGVSKIPSSGFIAGGTAENKSIIFLFSENGDTLETNIIGSGYPNQISINDIAVLDASVIYGGIYIENMPTDSTNAFVSQSDFNYIIQDFHVYANENSYMQNNLRKLLCDYHSNFLALGIFQTYDRGSEMWVRKYDNEFNLLWKRYIGGVEGETFRDAINTSDGGYLIIGESSSFDQYTSMYIVKTDSLGLGNYTSPVEEYIINKNNEFRVYPNPASTIVTIEFENSNNEYSIEIFDMSGRLVLQKISSDYQNYIDVNNLKNGLYMVRIVYQNRIFQSKLIINH